MGTIYVSKYLLESVSRQIDKLPKETSETNIQIFALPNIDLPLSLKGIGMLLRSEHLFEKYTFKTIHSAFALPHFDFCALVWSNCSKTLQNKIQKPQNEAGRIIIQVIATKLSQTKKYIHVYIYIYIYTVIVKKVVISKYI